MSKLYILKVFINGLSNRVIITRINVYLFISSHVCSRRNLLCRRGMCVFIDADRK